MSAVTDLQSKIQSLNDQLSLARAALQRAREAECPIKVGDRVRLVGDRNGKVAVIAALEFAGWREKPWAWVKTFNKDGALSKSSFQVFSAYEPEGD